MNTINYTLRAYATCPFTMKELSNSYDPKFKTVTFSPFESYLLNNEYYYKFKYRLSMVNGKE